MRPNKCTKVRYPDRTAARAAIRHLLSTGLANPNEGLHTHLRAYRCDYCTQFHFGHLPPAVIQGVMTMKEYLCHLEETDLRLGIGATG